MIRHFSCFLRYQKTLFLDVHNNHWQTKHSHPPIRSHPQTSILRNLPYTLKQTIKRERIHTLISYGEWMSSYTIRACYLGFSSPIFTQMFEKEKWCILV